MSRNDTSIQQELKELGWSIDDLFKHIIIVCYKHIENTAIKLYPGDKNYHKRVKYKYEQINTIPMTRQTIYNMIHTNHETTLDKAILIRDVINEARKVKDKKSEELDFSELAIYIYGDKTK